ncbi:MAG: hypothetical protein E7Z71_07520 [Methanocorpusculum parvum]|nr:hypothetical protein [Methanocorpusculum parvum]
MSLTINPKTLLSVSVVVLVISILLCVVSLCIVVPLLSPTSDNPQKESEPEEKTGPSWKYDFYDLEGSYAARENPEFVATITRDGQCTFSYMGEYLVSQLERQKWGDSKSNMYSDGELVGTVRLEFAGSTLVVEIIDSTDKVDGVFIITFYRIYE